MGPAGPKDTPRSLRWQELDAAFERHKEELLPSRIYATKLRKPGTTGGQLWFFDAGLMPAVEKNRGETLVRLIERVIGQLRTELSARLDSPKAEEDVYRTVFWLLAAKILHDKQVPNFKTLDVRNVDDVFDRIGRHHGDTNRLPPFGKAERPIIDAAANQIAACGALADVSSESLAYVYENALIDSSAGQPRRRGSSAPAYDIRKVLGIHSTPLPLIHHMLAQLWPMIEGIPQADRHVFEPACGHAPFLTAAMRWLRDWGGSGADPITHEYLRSHLHGLEKEPFALEMAKLALTLADEPHGNSWRLTQGDILDPEVLAKHAARARILLANPPYEAFTTAEKRHYQRRGASVHSQTKAVEVLSRSLPHLPEGSVFGVVVPQGVLHDRESRTIRKFLLAHCELTEVNVFADNLFEHGDHEVAVLMGRRRAADSKPGTLIYRRVRERGMQAFKDRLAFSSEREVAQSRFAAGLDAVLFLPDLPQVWDYLRDVPRLHATVDAEKGFELLPDDRLKGREVVSRTKRPGWVKAILRAADDYNIWELPRPVWIDPSRRNFRRPGAATKLGAPQVTLNYNRLSRGPWRLKAVEDPAGTAVSSNFVVMRPKTPVLSLRVLWAVMNSPVANAYPYCWSGKRQPLVREWRAFPFPTITPERAQAIERAAAAYLAAVESAEASFMRADAEGHVRRALVEMDSEVLRLYDLPPRLERQLLDLFSGWERKGVGCQFGDYFPTDFRPCVPLYEYISENYRRSTAGEIGKRFHAVRSDAAIAALDLAEKLAAGG